MNCDLASLIIRARDLNALQAIERARGADMTPNLAAMLAERVAMLKAIEKRPNARQKAVVGAVGFPPN
jgi:hypothetical protein